MPACAYASAASRQFMPVTSGRERAGAWGVVALLVLRRVSFLVWPLSDDDAKVANGIAFHYRQSRPDITTPVGRAAFCCRAHKIGDQF